MRRTWILVVGGFSVLGPTSKYVLGEELKLVCHKIVNKTEQNKSDFHIEVKEGNEIKGVGKGTWDNVDQQGRKADWTGDDLVGPGDFCMIYLKTSKEYDPKDGKWTPDDKLAMSIGVRTDYDGQGGVVLTLTNETPGVPNISISHLDVYTHVPLSALPVFGPIESLPDPQPEWTHAVVDASMNISSSVNLSLSTQPGTAIVAYFDYQGAPTDPGPFDATLLEGSHVIAAIEDAPVPAMDSVGCAGLATALIALAVFVFAGTPGRR
jgi:hypothetical protein